MLSPPASGCVSEARHCGMWEEHWTATCRAAWAAADPWSSELSAHDQDIESGAPLDPAAAQSLLNAYEQLKIGQSVAGSPEMLGLAERCGFVITEAPELTLPTDEAAQGEWLEAHERVKNAARAQHHEESRAVRGAAWVAILEARRSESASVDVTTNQGLEAIKQQLRQLVHSYFEPCNLGFHTWLSGLTHWLSRQRESTAALSWRVPDTQVTEVGSREFASELATAMCTFAAVCVESCADANTNDTESYHVWSLDPKVSNSRIEVLLGALPPQSKLKSAAESTCGEVIPATDSEAV